MVLIELGAIGLLGSTVLVVNMLRLNYEYGNE